MVVQVVVDQELPSPGNYPQMVKQWRKWTPPVSPSQGNNGGGGSRWCRTSTYGAGGGGAATVGAGTNGSMQ